MCDFLIVGVCNDDYVRKIKNKEPIYGEKDRVRLLEALSCVDNAVLVDIETTNDKILAYNKFGFDVLFVGDDWKGTERYIKTEKDFLMLPQRVVIEYLPYTKGISTSQIVQQIKANEI